MTIQAKTHSKPEKRERSKLVEKESARRSEGSTIASARSGLTVGGQHLPIGTRAYAARNPTAPLGPLTIPRREVGAHDVRIYILYCGVCHSDLAPSGIIVGRFEASQQPARRILEPLPCTKQPLQRGQTHDRARLGAIPACTSAHSATAQTKPRTPCFSSLKAVFSHFYPLNSPNIPDLHQVRDEWHNTVYPCVPGHEIVGRVVEVGREVTKFEEGELAAVGCMVDSCRTCSSCHAGYEQYCEHGPVFTYNSPDTHLGGITYGGYSESIVVDEAFVLRVAEKLDPAAVAPLVCAGITTYSPLRHWKVGKGQKVGIVGLGGLGHMAVKFARSFGVHVVLLTTSPEKGADAIRLGAHEVVVSKDQSEMNKHLNSLDFILDAVSAEHDINAYLNLLKLDGTLTLVGLPEKPLGIAAFNLIGRRRQFAGSMIGGIAETQEMLDYCAVHGIVSDVEVISMDQVNQAYERMLKGQVKYRFVIDMESL